MLFQDLDATQSRKMRPDPIFRSLLVLPRIDGRRMARGAERGRRVAKTDALGQGDDQVLPAQDAAAGVAKPAGGRGEIPAAFLAPERNNPASRHPLLHLLRLDACSTLLLYPPTPALPQSWHHALRAPIDRVHHFCYTVIGGD